jgi:protein-tyrosine phosphatase
MRYQRGMSSERWIELEGAVNARAVVPGALLRSDNLQSLTERDIELLIDDHALELVVDLRTDVEAVSEGPGPLVDDERVRISHHSLYPDSPGGTDVDISTINPWRLPHDDEFANERPAVRAYLSYLKRRPDSVIAAVRAIAAADGAVLVHCAAGKDRTGVIVAIALDAVGIDRPLIVRDYVASAARIEGILERLRGSDTYREGLEGQRPADIAPVAGTMERFLEIVDEAYGGSAAWLRDNGLSEDDLMLLARRLLPHAR